MPRCHEARLGKRESQRPDKPDFRILCGRIINGRPSCGGVLGHLAAVGLGSQYEDWYAVFKPGWKEVDGVWQMTRYARGRYEHHVRAATDPFADHDSRRRAAERLSTQAYAKNRRPEMAVQVDPAAREAVGGLETLRAHAGGASWLPTRAKCPRCTAVNSIGETLAHLAAQRWQSRHD